MSVSKKHIGIMGGTFDPIHNAHLALARQAYEQFSLDEVWLLPNGNPPHKKNSRQEDVSFRIEMVRLAISNIPYLKLCDVERSGQEYHYTFETLQKLKEEYPDTQFYFIMGADSLFDFEDWKEPGIISRECILLAASRDHCDRKRILDRIQELHRLFGADIRILNTPDMDIASASIRKKLLGGEDISDVVPGAVKEYIYRQGLYQSGQEEKI